MFDDTKYLQKVNKHKSNLNELLMLSNLTLFQALLFVEELLGLSQDMLQLGELEKVPLKRLCVLIHLSQFVLELLEGRF